MIVDINVAHKALLKDNDPDFKDIYAKSEHMRLAQTSSF
jgi:hypothetical protein